MKLSTAVLSTIIAAGLGISGGPGAGGFGKGPPASAPGQISKQPDAGIAKDYAPGHLKLPESPNAREFAPGRSIAPDREPRPFGNPFGR